MCSKSQSASRVLARVIKRDAEKLSVELKVARQCFSIPLIAASQTVLSSCLEGVLGLASHTVRVVIARATRVGTCIESLRRGRAGGFNLLNNLPEKDVKLKFVFRNAQHSRKGIFLSTSISAGTFKKTHEAPRHLRTACRFLKSHFYSTGHN